MSKKYKELAPTISNVITKAEIKAKKDKISKEQPVTPVYSEPDLSKEAVELALEYIRWMGASSIPWEYKEYYNNGPQDIAKKVCEKLGKHIITDEQVRVLYNEWKMIEYSDLEDAKEPINDPEVSGLLAAEDTSTYIFDEPAKTDSVEVAKSIITKEK